MHLFRISIFLVVFCLSLRFSTASIERTVASLTDEKVLKAKEFALSELRNLCEHCSEGWDATYRNLEITQVVSVETARSAFEDGTNYFFNVELEASTPGTYKGSHSIIVFSREDGTYKGMSIDEFPQIVYEEVYPL
mmetsp:Transcript_16836/g.27687  ORF Transcript_16836/g.27687 Transcript_16836/m.27687 type:complete len:136 (+) Transcript_16836:212-619(+)|eukprot:CAMPEP_0184646738 /NCGR_PEP_ID=MMETSP0308-20130426/3497_1 /TAXON_ID=38269 /ORGANISM="Gloeochaete witrockiana, Strain SAG 46.84" /LENGTH=135 /DNA_ID=CAMNT_0027077033 /DNA_START=169 /DNA_END=579 /DNA_ORIENTATION=-